MSEALTTFRRAVEGLEEALNGFNFAHPAIVERLQGNAELVSASLGHLSGDEIDVLGYIAERLKLGRIQYGQLEADRDRRDFLEERAAEAADLLVYHAAQAIRAARPVDNAQALNKRELAAYYLGVKWASEQRRPSVFRRFLTWIRS